MNTLFQTNVYFLFNLVFKRIFLKTEKYIAHDDDIENKYSLVYEGCIKQEEK